MKLFMLIPTALALVLAPTLAGAQLSTPLTDLTADHQVRSSVEVQGSREPPLSRSPYFWPTQTTVGTATEALMQAQVNGTNAAPLLPTMGAAAGLSYQRYLKSFTNSLPAAFDHTVKASK